MQDIVSVASPATTLAGSIAPLDTVARALLATRWELGVKRAVDITLSAVALVVLLPLLLLTAVAVGLTSSGPVLYAQRRVGRHGRSFTMLKFRSMRASADQQKAQLLASNETTGPVFKMRHDPRVTSVGRLIRKLSIDELPQLLNVIRGDMSLVGPRPPLREEYDQYTEHQRQRLLVRPGLTCIWQVSGRSTIGFAEWVEMDLDYIRRWNLALDVQILLRTIPAVLSGRGAF
jgi:exopolysaccharide biosynthesis polyprenyl glycosylphosphotransferase